jgi:molybdate transport system substrate-binding protein
MNILQEAGLLLDGSRVDLLNNKVVLIVPAGSSLAVSDFTGLVDASIKQIAVGDPEFVPAGTYAQQAFDLLEIRMPTSKLILGSDVCRYGLRGRRNTNAKPAIVYQLMPLSPPG